MTYTDERTLEQIYRSAVKGLYARIKSNYDFLYDKFGDEGIKLIAEMSHKYGLDIASRARNRLTDNSLLSIANYLLRIFETVSYNQNNGQLIQINPDKAIIAVKECPLHFDKKAMCQAHITMEKVLVEELNPNLEYRIGKSIPAGDSYCEHIIESRLQN